MSHDVLDLSKRKSVEEHVAHSSECNCAGIMLPPPNIRNLVAGSEDISTFFTLGHRGAQCIIDLLTHNHIDPYSMTSILDFGCGCNRVLMHLSDMLQKPIYGSDYNQKLVAWSSNNIRSGAIYLNDFDPPTQHAPSSFDLVYVLSIHTHLTEESQLDWTTEFARIIKPGGYLIFTTHGKHSTILDRLTPNEMTTFLTHGFVCRDEELEGANDCFTVQSEEYVRNTLCQQFEVVAFDESGAHGNPPQDIYLLRRKS